jgi:hypothetical protein
MYRKVVVNTMGTDLRFNDDALAMFATLGYDEGEAVGAYANGQNRDSESLVRVVEHFDALGEDLYPFGAGVDGVYEDDGPCFFRIALVPEDAEWRVVVIDSPYCGGRDNDTYEIVEEPHRVW